MSSRRRPPGQPPSSRRKRDERSRPAFVEVLTIAAPVATFDPRSLDEDTFAGNTFDLDTVDKATLDWEAIEEWSTLVETITYKGRRLPVVAPRYETRIHLDFDRAMCRAGIKAFVREVMPSDKPEPAHARHILVVEVESRVRARHAFHIVHNHEMN